jgi:hypothetical protein
MLTERADLDWLTDTTGIGTAREFGAILYGNEDYPDRVDLYRHDDYRTCLRSVALCSDGLAPHAPYWIKA